MQRIERELLNSLPEVVEIIASTAKIFVYECSDTSHVSVNNSSNENYVNYSFDNGVLKLEEVGSTDNINDVTIINGGNVVCGHIGGNIHIGDVTQVSRGRTQSIVNGRVFVNGREITNNQNTPNIETKPQLEIYVYLQVNNDSKINLDLDLSGISEFDTDINYQAVTVNCSGQPRVKNITSETASYMLSGQSQLTRIRVLNNSPLIAILSGQSTLRMLNDNKSSMQICNLTTTGQSSIMTNGTVKNYNATSSGQSHISHSGTISGRIKEKSSGQSTISV